MENRYKHLTATDRGIMEALIRRNSSLSEIGQELGVDKSTVSREIKKRSTPNGYIAWVAQVNYEKERRKCKKKKKFDNQKLQKHICLKLEMGWSPEQISGRLRIDDSSTYVCKETIYKFIYEDEYAKRE